MNERRAIVMSGVLFETTFTQWTQCSSRVDYMRVFCTVIKKTINKLKISFVLVLL